MEMRLIEVVSLFSLIESNQEKKIPIKTAFKLNNLIKILGDHMDFYKKKMTEIIEEYSEKNEEGKPKLTDDLQNYIIKKEYLEECQIAIDELSNFKIIIEDTIKFSFEELDFMKVNLRDTFILKNFIEEV